MRIVIQTNTAVVAAVVIVCYCLSDVICKDLSEIYQGCVKNSQGPEAEAVKQYGRCFPSLQTDPSCDSVDNSKCVTALADDVMFQKCIGTTNLETLDVVGKVFQSQYDYMCSEEGKNATQMFAENHGPECEMKHRDATLLCYKNAKYPIAGRSKDVEDLAGFAVDEQYCKALKQFDECEMEAIADCHAAIRHYTKVNRDVRWMATACQEIVNSGNSLTASILTLMAAYFIGGNLFS